MQMKGKIGGNRAGSTNPVVNFISIVVGAAIAAGALILGFLTFTFLAGLLLIVACLVAIRIWWIRYVVLRRSQSAPGNRPPGSDSAQGPVTIEGEFQPVKDRRDSTD